MPRTVTTDVIVLGLGAFGSATLYQLARRGVASIGIDRFVPPHDRGSSHGATRITRMATGEGETLVPLVRRSHAIWDELEVDTGRELLIRCGALIVGSANGRNLHHGRPDFVRHSIATAQRFDIAHEVLDADAIRARFPQFCLNGDEHGYLEPGGGLLRPEACIAAQLEMATRQGATLRSGETVVEIAANGNGVVVDTDRGRIVARHAIACLGPWTPKWLDGKIASLLSVYRQTLHWFTPADPAAFAPARFPVFIWMHGATDVDYFYGFPVVSGESGVKVATEQYERTSDPDQPDPGVPAAQSRAIYDAHLVGRLRGVTSACERASNCFYTVTPDASFIVDRHPEIEGLTVVSACSGHGFKHSAAMGEALAERAIDGTSAIDLAPFGLSRFTAPRAAGALKAG